MALVVYSQSRSFNEHIDMVVDGEVSYRATLSPPIAGPGNVYLVHSSSFTRELPGWLETAGQKGVVIGVAADHPQVEDLLAYTEFGVLAYFNAYMSEPNYDQVLRLLDNGQSWFPPPLLSETFNLARSVISRSSTDPLEKLTKRERDVALSVFAGNSNKLVARECNISERTVKAHLTQIFKKLEVKDRVALVIYLNQFDSLKANQASSG